MQLSGAQILVQSLIDQGTEILFGYPGGAVLNIYDALYEKREELLHIVTSHEQGAAHAADGYARSTGRTGVVLATSGPGATNLVTGIATAYQDSVPMVAVTGNVPRDLIGRDSFQEVDITGITNPIVKHNYIVQDVTKLASVIREAFVIANSGRKGPVLIDIPKDITAARCEFVPALRFEPRPDPVPDENSLQAAAQAIARCQKPLIYCGGGVTFSDSAADLQAFAQKIDAPVCVSMMGISSVPSDFPLYLGMIGMHGTATANVAAQECDLLIAVGARFSDRVAGNRKKFAAGATVIHIDIDQSEIYKNVAAGIPVVGNAGHCLRELTRRVNAVKRSEWVHHLLQHKALNGLPSTASDGDEPNPRDIVAKLRQAGGEDTIVVTDVGQHQMLAALYYPYVKPRTFISSCGLGTMGFGMGAANGVAFGNPGKPVVMITGDGSFHMDMTELAISVSHNLPVVVIVLNNGVLGMVHQWQNLFYNGRYAFTEIHRKTDFVKVAEAFGAVGLRIEKASEVRQVLAEAFSCGRPCVVDCRVDYKERVFPIIPPGGSSDDMIYTDDVYIDQM